MPSTGLIPLLVTRGYIFLDDGSIASNQISHHQKFALSKLFC